MSLRPEELHTIQTYDQMAQSWAQEHATAGYWKTELENFKQFLPSGDVLEIGSGGGRDAKELIAAGYKYTGTDVSFGLLKVAQQDVSEGVFVESTIYNLPFENESFDGFWASAVLLHLPKLRVNEALEQLNKVLRSGAVGFISIKQGEGERMETDGRYFSYYSQDEFQQILSDNGFATLTSSVKTTEGRTVWLTFIVKK